MARSLLTGPGRGQPKRAHPPVGSPPTGGFRRGRCYVIWLVVVGRGPNDPIPRWWIWPRDMEFHLTGGERAWTSAEVEQYRLEIIGLTSTHSLGWNPTPWERLDSLLLWSCLRWEAASWCGLAHISPAQPPCVGVLPGEQEGHFPASPVGDRSLTVVSAYGPNSSIEYTAFLEALGGVLESAPTGDSVALLGDFNAHMGSRQRYLEGVWLRGMASLIWTRVVFCCWTSVLVTVWR